MDQSTYKFRCALIGHQKDVRAVAVAPHLDCAILSGSRDMTTKLWIPNENNLQYTEGTVFRGHTNFISCICVIPADEKYPQGVILTGSNDKTILGFVVDSLNPVFKLEGHGDNVCALAAGKFGSVLSGSWDKTAKVWLNQKCVMTLSGHEAAVWDVAVMPEGGYMLTASADKTIKLWKAGKCQRSFLGHNDCVRGLAVLSNSEFLSCSNDGTVKQWKMNGECIHTFNGHTSYVYSLAILPDGKSFVSGGEDRCLRIWKEGSCFQTIPLPAQSVWSVCVLPNGDIAAGSSDGIVRVFSEDMTRHAEEAEAMQFEEEVAASSIPAQIGDMKTEDLPTPEVLLIPGKRDGQTMMVRENSMVVAHQWIGAEGRWQKIGEVVGGSGGADSGSGKKLHQGKEYDFVFDVDIQEGKPSIKLPYNLSEDPWMVAHNWLSEHEISQMFLDQVANFIVEQTSAVTLGQQARTEADPFTGEGRYVPNSAVGAKGSAADPFTGGGRYVPGQEESSKKGNITLNGKGESSAARGMFPVHSYISFDQANSKVILGKVEDFNHTVDGQLQIPSNELEKLREYLTRSPDLDCCVPVDVLNKLMQWPKEVIFPVVDILRLVILTEQANATLCDNPSGENLITLILNLVENKDIPANQMLALRLLTNAFVHKNGEKLLLSHKDEAIVAALNCRDSKNKNIQIAVCSLLLNYSIAYKHSPDMEDKVACLSAAAMVGKAVTDSEAIYRLLICIGTLAQECQQSKQLITSLGLGGFVDKCKLITDPKKVCDYASHLSEFLG